MAEGWIVIFEGKGPLFDERHPSGWVHRTFDAAEAARKRGTQVGKALRTIRINWDDSEAKKPWPP